MIEDYNQNSNVTNFKKINQTLVRVKRGRGSGSKVFQEGQIYIYVWEFMRGEVLNNFWWLWKFQRDSRAYLEWSAVPKQNISEFRNIYTVGKSLKKALLWRDKIKEGK